MKLIQLFLTTLIAFGIASNHALAEDFEIDIEHAFIQFKATHLGYSYVVGRFNEFEGTFSYDEDNPTNAEFSIAIDASSIDTFHAERDKHLRDDNYFEVDKYPDITFSSTAFEENEDGGVNVTGDLTLRGITKSIVIDGRHIGNGEDPWGGYRRGLEGSITLDATEFGFPEWVGDVEIYMVGEGIRG